MIYEIFDELPNVTNMINCRISHKPLNLEIESILLLNGSSLFAIERN